MSEFLSDLVIYFFKNVPSMIIHAKIVHLNNILTEKILDIHAIIVLPNPKGVLLNSDPVTAWEGHKRTPN